MIHVRNLDPVEARQHLSALADVLADCVEGGASVSFMAPLATSEAEGFYRKVISGVEAGDRGLLAAFDNDALVGTVQILTAMPRNQLHRADISKLLVTRSARGKGVGAALMEAAERYARAAGKTLLVLDTASGGDAERLYQRMNWTRAGIIPNYARFPDGRWCDTTIFWKALPE